MPHGPNHCKDPITIIKMEFWFTQFGVRMQKLWPSQKLTTLRRWTMAARPPYMAGRPSPWPPGHHLGCPATIHGRPASTLASQPCHMVPPTQRNTKGDESNRTIKYPMKPRVGRPSHEDCNPREIACSQFGRNTWPPGH